MRKKRNLAARLDRCASLRELEPERLRGVWLREFFGYDDLYVELGCGKGLFTVQMARAEPNVFFAALERVADAQIIAIERAYALEIDNIRFVTRDARDIADFFDEGEVGRVYINFCDPWPSHRHTKRRLTDRGFLEMYKRTLRPGGQVRFRTDDTSLFEFSLRQFALCGFELSDVTRDLRSGGYDGPMTDYELKFHGQGAKICHCVASLRSG
jgi:tRNA (guanine-N7-)-methyltransferase